MRTLPDGEFEYELIPLTLEDLLFPEEDDHAMQTPAHGENCMRLFSGIKILIAGLPGARVIEDCRVDFQVGAIWPMGPDVAVFLDVPTGWGAVTFRMGDLGARPALVVEVTLPPTRPQDLGSKIGFYHEVGVPVYVVGDS